MESRLGLAAQVNMSQQAMSNPRVEFASRRPPQYNFGRCCTRTLSFRMLVGASQAGYVVAATDDRLAHGDGPMEFDRMEEVQNEKTFVQHVSRGNPVSAEWCGSCGVDCCASGRDEMS